MDRAFPNIGVHYIQIENKIFFSYFFFTNPEKVSADHSDAAFLFEIIYVLSWDGFINRYVRFEWIEMLKNFIVQLWVFLQKIQNSEGLIRT